MQSRFHTPAALRLIVASALSLLVCISSQAQTRAISLSAKNQPVSSVLKSIEQKSGFKLFYNDSAVDKDRLVSVNAQNKDVQAILNEIFAGTNVKASIVDDHIVLSTLSGKDNKTAQASSHPKQIKVSGVIRDKDGLGVLGAAVMAASDRSNAAVADADGRFTITVNAGETLKFSALGYQEESMTVNYENSSLAVVLQDDVKVLDEVIVVGYGTQNRKTLTTSVSKVDGDVFYNAPVASVSEALKGKVPGLRIATNNALSGESPRLLIRGGSSINLSNDPIVVVDGIQRDMDDINPNDIESIEVLKDAASAAIYGARASNGVILVTTKKGNVSKGAQVTFEAQVGLQQPSRLWDMMSSKEYLAFIRPTMYATYNTEPSTPNPTYASFLTGPYSAGTGNDENSIYTTRYATSAADIPEGWDWMYDPINPTKVLTFTSNDYQRQWFHNSLWHKEYIGVNGGSKIMKYAASLGYLHDDGIVVMSHSKAFTAHANTSFQITKNLEASTTFDYSHTTKNPLTANYYNVLGRGITLSPTHRNYDSEGRWLTGGTHVAQQIPSFFENFYDRETANDRTTFNMNLKWQIIDGLKLVGQYAVHNNDYRGSYYAYGEVNNTPNYYAGTNRSTTETRTQTHKNDFQAYLNYKKTFGKHTVDAMAGGDYMYWRYWYLTANATGSTSDKVPHLQSGTTFTASDKDETESLLSWFGRINYDYAQKYILSATMRADASSKFAPENRWGFFPSGSAAWVISEEPFWENCRDVANHFKFRASYGLTGNNGIGRYDTYGSFSTANLYAGQSVTLPSAMVNLGLKWETTAQLDLGFDVNFLKDRIRFTIDYYDKVTRNMLMDVTLPDTGTFGSAKGNVGSAKFYGFEFELHTVNFQKKNFTWSTDLTYSFNKNKVLALADEYKYTDLNGNDAWRIGGYTMSESGERFGGTAVGEPLGRIYGYKIDHIIQTTAEADAAYYDNLAAGYRRADGQSVLGRKDVGDYEWCNRAGSSRLADGSEQINAEDMFCLGNVMPHSTGGFNNTFSFYGVTINVYFDYAAGHSIYNYMKARMFQNNFGNCNANVDKAVYDCWRYPGDTKAKYARFFPNDPDFGNRNYSRCSDFNVEKADYLCLRDLSIMYDLPEKWTKAMHMKKFTIGVTGNTLWYWTAVSGSICPETGMGTGASDSFYSSVSTGGNENSSIAPTARKILFNIKLTF